MKSNKIKDTTKEEREEICNWALGVTLSATDGPSEYVLDLAKKYINGEMEIEEIHAILNEKYKRLGESY